MSGVEMIERTPSLKERIEADDKKIKSLENILNNVKYIATLSSCGGHYWALMGPETYRANVIFEIDKGFEADFETLTDLILEETEPYHVNAFVSIFKEHYRAGGKSYVRWQLRIEPSKRITNPSKKREITDLIIKGAVRATEKYLTKNPNYKK